MTLSFFDAVRTYKLIKQGDRINPSALFPNHDVTVNVGTKETGWNEEQIFSMKAEDNLRWHYIRDYMGADAIVATTTKFKLHVKGKLGYANIIPTLYKLVQPFSNTEIGIVSRPMDQMDVKNMPMSILLVNCASTLLASQAVFRRGYDSSYCIYFLGNEKAFQYMLYEKNREEYICYGFRPIISVISHDIRVETNSLKRDGAWRLLPPKTQKN